MKNVTESFCRRLSLAIYFSGILLFYSDSITALQNGISFQLSPSPSLLLCRHRKLLKPRPFVSVGSARIRCVSPLLATSFSIEVGQTLAENMIVRNNALGAAAALTTIAVISSILSRRRTAQIQNELDLLKEEIRRKNSTQSKKENADSNTEDKTDNCSKAQENRKFNHQAPTQSLYMDRIGVIRSIYRLCVGTPRQGLLAPDARGRIELDKIGNSSTGATVSGLEDFSYIWILFHFHLNTQSSKKERRFKSKIAPPALGGKKVGIYSTRSPHRHNPIGITLCKLDRIQVHGPHEVTLHVSGLDLVDGTPVLDIKPYVPVYDSVNIVSNTEQSTSTLASDKASQRLRQLTATALQLPPPRVPDWIEGGLATKRNVVITRKANEELKEILNHDSKALQFYGSHCFTDINKNAANTLGMMLRVIEQVLSIDVRSSHQTRKARTGRSQAERAERIQARFDVDSALNSKNDCIKSEAGQISSISKDIPEKKMCTQQLDNLLIFFSVKESNAKRESSEGSGAEDEITVESIQLLPNTEKKKRRHT